MTNSVAFCNLAVIETKSRALQVARDGRFTIDA